MIRAMCFDSAYFTAYEYTAAPGRVLGLLSNSWFHRTKSFELTSNCFSKATSEYNLDRQTLFAF